MTSIATITDELKRAKLYEAFKRFDRAIEVYRVLIDQYPNDFRAYFNCARLLAFQDTTLEEALQSFCTVIRLDPSVIETYGAVAAILIKLDRPVEAAKYCQSGLRIDSLDQNCMYNLNIALRQLGDIQEVIATSWDKLIGTYGVQTSPSLRLGEPYQKLQNEANVVQSEQCITAVCVKWGTKYGPEYVNNLHRAIQRHTPSSRGDCRAGQNSIRISKLICFTDDSTGVHPDVTCLPFDASTLSWRGWWLKAQMFAPSALLQGWLLYVDLDTVVCGILTFLGDLVVPIHSTTPDESVSSSGSAVHADISKIFILGAETFRNEGEFQ